MTAHSIARRRQYLYSRIHRRYQTSTSIINIGPMKLEFTRIANPDLVLDEVAAEEDRREKLSGQRHEDPLHLPYWAELWDSAAGLGQYLVNYKIDKTTKVLDLGCGMGMAGTVAARLGGQVLFADLESPALLFAQINSLENIASVRTRKVNWQTDNLAEKFDLILGADILYERKQWEFLVPFWKSHLLENGSILLGEPGRQSGILFEPWIQKRGWLLEESSEKVPTRETPIRIFKLSLKSE